MTSTHTQTSIPPSPKRGSDASPVGLRADYYDQTRMQSSDAILAKMAVRASLTADSAKLILAMVGLPARGKSFIAHKLHAFLNWSGSQTQIFNAGQKRRKKSEKTEAELLAEEEGPTSPQRERSAASFFDPTDPSAKAAREGIAMQTLDELLLWFDAGGEIGIYDATNSTRERRAAVQARAAAAAERAGHSVSVVFIESVCDEEALLEANMVAKVRASPDFKDLSEAAALADLRERIGHYERAYETVADEEGAYIKLYNLSSKVSANQVFGRMSTRVLPYLTALHIRERPVYLAALLPGEVDEEASLDDSFAHKLASWVARKGARLRLLSSTQPSAMAAARAVAGAAGAAVTHQSALNPIDRGGIAPEQKEQLLATMSAGLALPPRRAAPRRSLRLTRSAPCRDRHFQERFAGGGESFADLVRRLEPCLLEIEASMEPVLVLAHSGPCRALRTYFLALADVASCMGAATSVAARALADEAHSVVELVPTVGGGYTETVVDLEGP
eukprot:Transcript_24172.p1 GENE.Transcript_24172~~Transcript_24172.p1  ORF type:complete len:504 (+),score=199.17 Transcript_24172:118-1629(+)